MLLTYIAATSATELCLSCIWIDTFSYRHKLEHRRFDRNDASLTFGWRLGGADGSGNRDWFTGRGAIHHNGCRGVSGALNRIALYIVADNQLCGFFRHGVLATDRNKRA